MTRPDAPADLRLDIERRLDASQPIGRDENLDTAGETSPDNLRQRLQLDDHTLCISDVEFHLGASNQILGRRHA